MRQGTTNRSMGVLALFALLVQIAAGLPARSQTRSFDHTHYAREPAAADLNNSRINATPYEAVDWSRAMVDSTMKRFSTAKDLGSWGYAKSLYLYGEYLVWKRTRDPRYL